MRSLKNKPQVIAPTNTYPYGRIQDDDGSGTKGTPVTEQVYGDFHQFFMQLMKDGGLTPNEIAENEYDGFQLNTALINLMRDVAGKLYDSKLGPWVSFVSSLTSPWVQYLKQPNYRIRGSQIFLEGSIWTNGSSTTSALATLPSVIWPSKAQSLYYTGFTATGTAGELTLDTSGNLTIGNTGSGAVVISFDGVSYWLD